MMLATVKYAVYLNHILKAQTQRVKLVSVRHYPRWTHRRPIYIVDNTCSQEEKEQWKLNVEREIVRDSGSETPNVETNLSSQPGAYQKSFSYALLKDNGIGVSRKTHQSVSESPKSSSRSVNMVANHKDIHSEERSKKEPNKKVSSGSVHETRNVLKDFSFQRENDPRVQKQAVQNTLDKRKIITEKELETRLKMRESAHKLGVPLFTELGADDTVLSKYLTNVKSKKKREKKGKILLEGKRLIRDALDAGVIPEAVFFSRIRDLKDLNLPQDGVKIYKIIYKKLCLWSDVATSQGVLAILKTPTISKEGPASVPLTVICDNVRDPGNLGTILRTCAGVGCKRVILTKGCVDLWDPRVLRAGAGAHFRMSITQAENWTALVNEMDEDSCVCVAENNIIHNSTFHQKEKSDTDTEIESDTDDGGGGVKSQRSECDSQESKLNMVPMVPYYALNYFSFPSIVLIVGGETEGVSSGAYQYASKTNGVRVNIPLSNSVDSLNCATALSIIAFEMKKQFLMKENSSDKVVKENIDNSQNSKASVMNM